uniref:Laminin subunit alpha-2 n=1 Tax=Zeugodacus cucurbitae TaxID=28588 RepID=A0A0A1XK26_ZEUCU
MAIRTKDQLAVLLKLIEVNKIGLTRRNLSIRQRIWQVITQKLNEMQGAEKDVEGWKRSYNSWRLNAGKYHEEEKERIIKDVADDDYFIINVTEDDMASDTTYDETATYLDPKDRQLTLLHELVSKQRLLFINTAEDDEPLRQRLWQNIADELNSIPDGVKLPKEEWQKHVDLRQYTVPRGRKRKHFRKPAAKDKNNELDVLETANKTPASYESAYEEYIVEDFPIIDKPCSTTTTEEQHKQKDVHVHDVFAEIDDTDDNTDDIINLLNEHDDSNNASESFPFDIDDVEGDDFLDNAESVNNAAADYDAGKSKRARLTPIVKSFKFSNRIVNAVEQLKDDVKETKDMLKQTTNLLNRMCNIMEERNKKQDETNALLKRNGQILKILVEYKCGMRGKAKK